MFKVPRGKSLVVSSLSAVRIRLCIKATSSFFHSLLALDGRLTGSSPSRVRTDLAFVSHRGFSHAPVLIIGITVNTKTVDLPTGGLAAIDTGTTLIGGPAAAVAAVYAQIPGSQPLSGNLAGFYGFRAFVFVLAKSLVDILFS